MRALFVAVVAVSLAACSKCGSAPVDGPALTDQNTVVPEGRLVHAPDGGSFTLTMPDSNWRVVTEEARAKLKPEATVWVINGVRHAQVSVQCAPGISLEALEGALRSASAASGQTYTQLSREKLEGPWRRALEVTYSLEGKGQSFAHVDGLFELVGTSCVVQAWATDGVQTPELRRVVRSYAPVVSPAELAVVAPLRAFDDPAMQALAERLADAGATDLVPAHLVERGTVRLEAALLEERFALRRRLLAGLPDELCAALVAHTEEPAALVYALNTLDPASAARWGELSVAAMKAELSGQQPEPFDRSQLAEAQTAYLALPGARDAEMTVTHLALTNAKGACDAEKTRLAAVQQLAPEFRIRIYRSWVAPLQ